MEALKVEATQTSPDIILDKDAGKFEISGVSRPENVTAFYEPVMNWLQEYASDPLQETKFVFKFLYFNTSSLKSILAILSKVKLAEQPGKTITVYWYYDEEDESMLEAGNLIQELSELEFEYITNEE